MTQAGTNSVAVPALRLVRAWRTLGWCWVALIIAVSLYPRLPDITHLYSHQDKLEHFLVYAFVMGWFVQLYTRRRDVYGFGAGFILLGIALEILQGLGGMRMFDVFDMLANSLGVLFGAWLGRGWLSGSLAWLDRRLRVDRQ